MVAAQLQLGDGSLHGLRSALGMPPKVRGPESSGINGKSRKSNSLRRAETMSDTATHDDWTVSCHTTSDCQVHR